jgi:hypothetical protein
MLTRWWAGGIGWWAWEASMRMTPGGEEEEEEEEEEG